MANKKSFTLLELILIIIIISIIAIFFESKTPINKLELATNRLALYLKQTRYLALIDDKYNSTDTLWHKKRWTLKFFRCSHKVGGIYYSIYSDTNKTGHPSASEALKDPLTNKSVYSTNKCEPSKNYSKYVLLTKEFNIENIEISCNSTSSLGQISFGNNGKVYSKLSSYDEDYYNYEIENICRIIIVDKNSNKKEIKITPKTGFIEEI